MSRKIKRKRGSAERKEPPLQYHFIEAGQPPALKPLLGKRIERAYLLPKNRCLFFLIEGGRTMMIEGMPPMNGEAVVKVETGYINEGARFDDIEDLAQDPYVQNLVGRTLTELDGTVLVFDNEVGAKLLPDRIEWVKRKEECGSADTV